MTVANAPAWACELLGTARVGRLGLLDENDNPRVQPVTFVLLGEVAWSAIDQKPKRQGEPARVARLRRRPEAALVVDHYDENWDALAWVQALGRVEVAALEQHSEVGEALREKYRQYREQPPIGPLLGLHIERLLSWRAADSKPPDQHCR